MRKGIYKNEFIRQQETPKVNNFISYSGTCAYTLRYSEHENPELPRL